MKVVIVVVKGMPRRKARRGVAPIALLTPRRDDLKKASKKCKKKTDKARKVTRQKKYASFKSINKARFFHCKYLVRGRRIRVLDVR